MLDEAGRFKAHTLSVNAESVMVDGDMTRLQQIITNLFSNAIKYTPAGGSIHVLSSARERTRSLVFRTLGSASALTCCPRCSSCSCKAIPVQRASAPAWGSAWLSSVVLSSFTAAPWRRQVTGPDRAVRSLCVCRESPRGLSK
jgi:signal transduction histidine kinase